VRQAINDAIGNLPNSIPISEGASGSTGSTCIIPGILGSGCICSVSADYHATIKDITGLKSVSVSSIGITSLDGTLSPPQASASIGGSAGAASLGATGSAGASANACGVSIDPSGSASATVNADVGVSATANISPCTNGQTGVKVGVSGFKFNFSGTRISRVSVGFGLGPLDSLLSDMISGITSALQAVAPSLVGDLANEASPALQSLASTAVNSALPECLQIPNLG